MADSHDVLNVELNKLCKSDLIDLLIKQSLPEGVTSEPLLNFTKLLGAWKQQSAAGSGEMSTSVLSSGVDAHSSKCNCKYATEVRHLNEILTQKDAIIFNQNIAITSLQSHNSLLNDLLGRRVLDNSINSIPDVPSMENKGIVLNTAVVPPPANVSNKSTTSKLSAPSTSKTSVSVMNSAPSTSKKITQKQVSTALHEIQATQKCSEIISLSDINNSQQWKTVTSRRRPRSNPPTIIGTGNSPSSGSSGMMLKAVPVLHYFHVYRLDPKTTPEMLLNNLQPRFPEVNCSRLDSRFPDEYSSFKVGIYEDNVEKFLDPHSWPAGIRVNKFFRTKKRSSE